ncbi:acyltransferase family protein [Sediminispirochaeta bajacaliforniensis]|uniref:acyltransferase family protein n=1 Tax=Sediminispirochaeta bajacaliforniensis TaxID=148 RepID=UPI0003739E48|nr:acyltransferase family protein [Sediminispirochaeta bajacaliforniensis]
MIEQKQILRKGTQREYFLDWIKVSVVLLLVPYHTAVSFSHIGHAYIYIEPKIDSWFYILMSDFLNLWFMRILFFISGISVYLGLRKRTPKEFIVERFKRLILPIVFLVLTIGPLSGYVLATTRYGFTGSFFAFYPQFFLKLHQYLFWAQLWYCGYLFVFSLIGLPICVFLKERLGIVAKINGFLAGKYSILLPGVVIVIFEMSLRPFFPGYQSLIGDWANEAVYFSLFIFGYIMGQSKDIFRVMARHSKLYGTIGAISSLVYLYVKRFCSFIPEGYGKEVLVAMLWGIAAYALILFILGFAKTHFYKNSPLLAYLSKSSFALYVFHYAIITFINFFLLKSNMNHYLVWGLSTISTYLVFTLLFECVLKRNSFFCYICSIRK